MKKLISLLLAVLMLSALAVPAFAADPSPTQDTTGTAAGDAIIVRVFPSADEIKGDRVIAREPAADGSYDEDGAAVPACLGELTDDADEQMRTDFEALQKDAEAVRKSVNQPNLDTAYRNGPAALIQRARNAGGWVNVNDPAAIVAGEYPCWVSILLEEENLDHFLSVVLYEGGRWVVPQGMRVDEVVNPDTQETEHYARFILNGPAFICLVYLRDVTVAP